jgi:hypothetical protein
MKFEFIDSKDRKYIFKFGDPYGNWITVYASDKNLSYPAFSQFNYKDSQIIWNQKDDDWWRKEYLSDEAERYLLKLIKNLAFA